MTKQPEQVKSVVLTWLASGLRGLYGVMVGAVKQSRTESNGRPEVLVVEDEQVSRRALGILLTRCGYRVELAESAEEALRLLERRPRPEVVLLDVDLPGMSGLDLLATLQVVAPDVAVVLITGADRDIVWPATRRGVPYLRKPLNFQHLLAILKQRWRAR